MARHFSPPTPPYGLATLLLLFFCATLSLAAPTLRYSIGYLPASSTSTKPTHCGVILGTPIERPSRTHPNEITTHYIWSLESYSAPASRKDTDEFARLGLLDDKGKAFNGSTTLARLAALKEPARHAAELYVQLDDEKLPESVALRQVRMPAADSEPAKEPGIPRLLVMTTAPESRPVLNKPVVLNAEGRVDAPVQEKTLLQKYWWVLAIMLAMTVMGGGEGGK